MNLDMPARSLVIRPAVTRYRNHIGLIRQYDKMGAERERTVGKLQGKVAVITGGTQGIGLATAKLFASEGAYVFITGRRRKELEEAVASIGNNVTGIQGDVANLADLDRLYESVEAKGRIDVLFANVGLGGFVPLGSLT